MSRARMSSSVFSTRSGSWSRLAKGVAGLASGATFAGLAIAIAPPAQAATPDDESAALAGMLTSLSKTFLPDVATSTALSQQLPTIAITPAGSVDLKNGFKGLTAAGGPLADVNAQADLGALRGYIDGDKPD